ncbi:MAG: hypothetical protein ACRD7E_22395 [Bryobacteraceae bacterium]
MTSASRIVFCALAVLHAPVSLMAQGNLSGPVAGFVLDSAAGSLRPILGTPGSTTLGQPVESPFRFRLAVFPRGQKYALAAAEGQPFLMRINLDRPSDAPLMINGADAQVDALSLSAGGDVAALYRKSDRSLQILSGLNTSPQAGARLDAAMIPGDVKSLAISEDGRLVLIGIVHESGGSVWGMGTEGEPPRMLMRVSEPSALAFVPGTYDALIADAGGNAVHLLRNAAGNGLPVVLADASSGVAEPAAVLASADGSRAFIANTGTRSVLIAHLSGTSSTIHSCDCAPSALQPLRSPSAFLLTSLSSGKLWLLDAYESEPRIFFVPPDQGSRILDSSDHRNRR